MMLWAGFAVLTTGVLYALLRPLLRPEPAATADRAADLAVYRDQMAQLDADAERGVMDAADIESARLEVARRILKSAAAAPDLSTVLPPQTHSSGSRVMLAAIGLVPVFAMALYLTVGSPWLPAKPYAGGGKPVTENAELTELVQRVEARLRQVPEEGKGWDVLAPVYFKSERFEDAANAYSNAARILGETPARLAGFAEATVMANGGRVVPEARAAYEKILKVDPSRFEPRFWLALGREQDGEKDAALAEYQALIRLPALTSDGREIVAQRIVALGGTPPADKGPTAADVQSSAQMTDAERGAMIAGMVDSLAARLKKDGKDQAGWLRLIQSYSVLGRRDQALAAIADARRNLADNPQALDDITALVKSLRLGS
jgi:cytochrome c-type biogenesis protein CcmH